MSKFLNDNFTWFLILILLVNMSQRKLKNSDKKRQATIYIAVLALIFYIGVIIIDVRALPSWALIIALIIPIIIGIIFRNRVWPYRLHCKECGKKLDWNHIIGHDENICTACYDKHHPEEAAAKAEAKKTPEEKRTASYKDAKLVSDIDWDNWEPTDRCVITYVQSEKDTLFIEKKQGLGTGYYNAPGGHIELEETATEAAIRETKEETGLDITNPVFRGTLHFQFADGMREIGYVYFTNEFSGTLKECDEARPFWIATDSIPYENMWEDDRLWLPKAMEGCKFDAYFVFDGKTMSDHSITWLDEESDE